VSDRFRSSLCLCFSLTAAFELANINYLFIHFEICLTLLPSTGCCWNCSSCCLISWMQWPRLTVWFSVTYSRLSSLPMEPRKGSNSTSRRMSMPRSKQSYRSVSREILEQIQVTGQNIWNLKDCFERCAIC